MEGGGGGGYKEPWMSALMLSGLWVWFGFVLIFPNRKQEAIDGTVGRGAVGSVALSIWRQDALDHREEWS